MAIYPANTAASQDFITHFCPQHNHHQLVPSLKHVHPFYHQRHLYNQTISSVNSSLLLADSNAYSAINNYNSNHLSTPNSHSFAVEFENQMTDVECFIMSQNERMRIMWQEKRKHQQAAALLKKVETDAVRMLSEKDEEIAQAAKKRAELEEFLARVEADNLLWRRVAQEKEAVVLSLHNTLEQIQEERTCHNNNSSSRNIGMETEDAESCCDEIRRRRMVCRICNNSGRYSCMMMLVLPCRHLCCCCKGCEPFVDACPVCRMPKKSIIETLLF